MFLTCRYQAAFWFDLNQIVLRTLSMVQIDPFDVGINFVARVLVVPIGSRCGLMCMLDLCGKGGGLK